MSFNELLINYSAYKGFLLFAKIMEGINAAKTQTKAKIL